MSEPTECTATERGLLGVKQKLINETRPGEFPPKGVPTLMTDKIHLPPADTRREGAVAVTESAIEDALGRFASEPDRQNVRRIELLFKLGFDATKPYEVIHDLTWSVYLFRSLSGRQRS
jgi:hypothetical protein